MLFLAWWLSIPPFQHFAYHPACDSLLSLRLQLTFLPQRSLSPPTPQSISPSLCWLRCEFLIFSPPQAAFWIESCLKLQGLRPVLPPSHSCLDMPEDIVVWRALLISYIYLPVVAKGSFSEHWPLHFVLTLLMDKMMDVERYGPHSGKLCLYVEVGTLNRLEQSKNCVLTVTTLGIAMLTVHYDMMFSVCLK